MKGALPLLAFLAGAGLALQVGFNNALRARLGHPLTAALVSFGSGTIALAVFVLIMRAPLGLPPRDEFGPWWIWLGGLVGALYVASAAAYASRLGAAAWMALVIAGQLLASLVLDHVGLVGFAPHPINALRLLGAALLLAGVVLVLSF
jgi:transporter family-2 protein